jgi:hypothetical protein
MASMAKAQRSMARLSAGSGWQCQWLSAYGGGVKWRYRRNIIAPASVIRRLASAGGQLGACGSWQNSAYQRKHQWRKENIESEAEVTKWRAYQLMQWRSKTSKMARMAMAGGMAWRRIGSENGVWHGICGVAKNTKKPA